MTGLTTRYLYIVRHGEALADESGLSENGRRQAVLVGQRLRGHPISAVYHGPLPRAAQTAHLIAEQLGDVTPTEAEDAGDYVPYMPTHANAGRVATRQRRLPHALPRPVHDR